MWLFVFLVLSRLGVGGAVGGGGGCFQEPLQRFLQEVPADLYGWAAPAEGPPPSPGLSARIRRSIALAGSSTRSSINQRHFQCPITETEVLGLSAADSSPIHLPAPHKKAARFPPPPQAGRPL